MRVVLVTTHLGVSETLASTAFISAFADGLTLNGDSVLVVGLAQAERYWNPSTIPGLASHAPWIGRATPSFGDALDAARRGITQSANTCTLSGARDRPDWFLELLLDRDLEAFAAGEALTLFAYPRSYPIIRCLSSIARRRGWKLVLQSSEALTDAQIDAATRNSFVRCVVERADGVWALSEYLGSFWHEKGVARERVLVQPNVVRESAFLVDAVPMRKDSAVYVGNLLHQEVEYLLDVSIVVRATLPEFRLVIYGDATEARRAELRGMIEARSLVNTVRLCDPVPPYEVPRILRTADALLLPRARGEFSTAGFPNKLGEYLASARPVVVTAVGDIPKYLTDGESAFLVDPDDCAALATAVINALTDTGSSDMIGLRGRTVAHELLGSRAVAHRLLRFIDSLPPPVRDAPHSSFGQPATQVVRFAVSVVVSNARRQIAKLWHDAQDSRLFAAVRKCVAKATHLRDCKRPSLL